MIDYQNRMRFSCFADLYDMIIRPDDKLRVFHDNVDFLFILKMLCNFYSKDKGRYAINPITLFKALILKLITEMSDRDLVEAIRVNMSFKFFLDMNPEDEPFDASLLSYFRRKRLKDSDLLQKLLDESLRLAVGMGVIKSSASGKITLTVAIDSTHTESLGRLFLPCEGIRYFCNKLIKAIRECYNVSDQEWGNVPALNSTEEAIAYGKAMLERVKAEFPDCTVSGDTKLYYNRLVEAIEDIADHGTCSPSDRDARKGHKSANSTFDGYKEHLGVDVDSGVIVAAKVTSGEASDTTVGEQMVKEMVESDAFELERLLGDGAYGSTAMMQIAHDNEFDLVATPNHMLGSSISNYLSKGFTYNKDADMLVCPSGHMAIRACTRHYKNEGNRAVRMFYFDIDKCRSCSRREGCYKDGAKSKSCSVSILTDLQKEYLKKTKTEEFKEHFKRRTTVERTNGELKGVRRPGLRKANYYGKEMMTVQTAIAIFVYNLKKILLKKVG